jgi:hypothetical protein
MGLPDFVGLKWIGKDAPLYALKDSKELLSDEFEVDADGEIAGSRVQIYDYGNVKVIFVSYGTYSLVSFTLGSRSSFSPLT